MDYRKETETTAFLRMKKTARVMVLTALALSPLLSSIAIAEGNNTSASTMGMMQDGGINARAQFNAAQANTGMGSNANTNRGSGGGVYFDSNVNSTTCMHLSRTRDRYSDADYANIERRCTEEGYYRADEINSRTSLR